MMSTLLRILILEDQPADAELVLHELRQAGFEPVWQRVETEWDYLAHLDPTPDLILADYTMPQFNALRALELIQERGLDIPFIVVSGTIGEEVAVAAMKHGATDYLLKDRLARLGHAVAQALEQTRLRDERRRAEAERVRLAKDIQLLLESTDEGIYGIDLEGGCTFINRSAAEILGYERTEVLGKHMHSLIHHSRKDGSLYPAEECPIYAAFGTGRACCVDNEVFWRRNGRCFPVEYSSYPIVEEGSVKGAVITFTDIAERKRAEEALVYQAKLLSEVNDAIIAADTDYRITIWNKAAERIYGWTAEEVIGKQIDEIIQVKLSGTTREQVRREVLEKGAWRGEAFHHSRDDQEIVIDWSISTLKDAAGNTIGTVAINRDITEHKLLEAQLLQAQKLESLGTLVGGIAHDFNNMLTGILGFAQLLLRDVEPTTNVYEGLRRIESLSERAADMVRQLLAFSRQDVSQKKNLALHPFLKEIGKLLRRMIPENIEIELTLASADFMIEADPTQLHQVVMNLAVNARDAMPEGGRLRIETARVELDDTFCHGHPGIQPGRYVRLSVSDTGTGVAPEIRSRIFDPFFTTKPVGKGTGLGLPVVYGIVKNHSGAIEVESEVGRGATVQIYLPLTEKVVVTEERPSDEIIRGTETILLVEDEPTVVALGQTALQQFGYRVLTASNGLEAIAVYRQHRDEIALVILDVVMPRMGGREAFKELKRLNPGVRVLLATAYAPEEVGEELLDQGVYGLLRKPYQIDELAQAVRAALEPHPVKEREAK
ncbi:MAG: PAS domain S-box protein [Acidobacteria bacterium]|nr:PAS domain S-box protein [Acidobacteriota bacterium]